MDREQFLHSIRSTSLETKDIVVNFFDQYMLLYDLVDSINNIIILNSNESSILFQLDFSDNESVEKLCEKIEMNSVVTSYGSFYNISYTDKTTQSVVINIQR